MLRAEDPTNGFIALLQRARLHRHLPKLLEVHVHVGMQAYMPAMQAMQAMQAGRLAGMQAMLAGNAGRQCMQAMQAGRHMAAPPPP